MNGIFLFAPAVGTILAVLILTMNNIDSPGGQPAGPTKPQPDERRLRNLANGVFIALILGCLALGVILLVQHHKHGAQARHWDQTFASYSNQVVALDDKLAQQILVNETLETNLTATKQKASNDLATVETTLSATSSSLERVRAEAKAAQAAIEEKDKRIADLEGQNTELDKQSSDLRSSITNLQAQIETTQKKLDADEGDKQLLMAELTHLRAQKDELEKRLTDLAFLKETVRKLKEDLAVARRLDWIRRGIYDAIAVKGGERLTHPLALGTPGPAPTLDVEIQQNGAVSITPRPAPETPENQSPK